MISDSEAAKKLASGENVDRKNIKDINKVRAFLIDIKHNCKRVIKQLDEDIKRNKRCKDLK